MHDKKNILAQRSALPQLCIHHCTYETNSLGLEEETGENRMLHL